MKKVFLFAVLSALALTGCRREDIRTFTVEITNLAPEKKPLVESALRLTDSHWYDGVMPESFAFDFDRHTFTLRYDSMKIAQTNIRMLLRDKGLDVVFPTNVTGRAGH